MLFLSAWIVVFGMKMDWTFLSASSLISEAVTLEVAGSAYS